MMFDVIFDLCFDREFVACPSCSIFAMIITDNAMIQKRDMERLFETS